MGILKGITGTKEYLSVDAYSVRLLFSIPSFSFSKLYNSISPRHLSLSVAWQFFCDSLMHISEARSPNFWYVVLFIFTPFCYCSIKIIFKIELKPNFNIKADTKKPLHLNTFSHIEMRYEYSTYSISPAKVKQDSETNLVNCDGSQMS